MFHVLIIPLSLNHGRKPLIGGAYPPVVPVADELSPDECFKFLHGHAFRIIPSIKQFLLHPCPYALTAGIVMAASSGAVHALDNAVSGNCPALNLAGVLCSPVGMDDGAFQLRICTNRIFKRPLT